MRLVTTAEMIARPMAPPTVRVTLTSAEATPVRPGGTRYTAATVMGM